MFHVSLFPGLQTFFIASEPANIKTIGLVSRVTLQSLETHVHRFTEISRRDYQIIIPWTKYISNIYWTSWTPNHFELDFCLCVIKLPKINQPKKFVAVNRGKPFFVFNLTRIRSSATFGGGFIFGNHRPESAHPKRNQFWLLFPFIGQSVHHSVLWNISLFSSVLHNLQVHLLSAILWIVLSIKSNK